MNQFSQLSRRITRTWNLRERPAFLGLGKIPQQKVLLADLTTEVRGSLSATTQGTNDNDLGGLAAVGLDSRLKGRLDVVAEGGGVVELGDRTLRGVWVQNLVGPAEESNSSTGVASSETVGGHTAPFCVSQEFEVVESAASFLEASEPDFVAILLLHQG